VRHDPRMEGDGTRDGPRRLIGPFDATMLVVGSMIGSGIFIVSAESARLVGTPGRLLLVWGVAGLLTVLAALSCAELAVLFPSAGGPYVFFREAYGPMWGFLFGWTLILVVQTGTIAAVAVAFSKFLGVLVPSVSGGTAKLVAAAVVLVLTATNALGLKAGTRLQNVLTVVKVAALLGLTAAGLFLASTPQALPTGAHPEMSAPAGLDLAFAFALALVGPSFAQSAWTNVTFPGAEVKNPGRTFPVALVAGCLLVAGLYVLANLSYLKVLGLPGIAYAAADRVGTASAAKLLPGAGGALMAAAILVSTFGCANGLILSGSRVIWALAADGLFFRAAAPLNAAGVPGRALAFQAGWTLLLVASGTYSELLRYVVSVEFLILILLVVAVPVLRRKRPELPRPFRAPAWPLTGGLFAVAAGALVVLLALGSPRTTWPGLLLVLLGVGAWRALSRRAA
jgi:basic amino acid/polyamine antiporter, APA family